MTVAGLKEEGVGTIPTIAMTAAPIASQGPSTAVRMMPSATNR